jgi:cupin fold WbuC family metalloprotein
VKRIDRDTLKRLSAEAAAAPRRRKNLNLHATAADPIQRMCNAFEPGTYVRPHRHTAGGVWELFVVLSGVAAVLTFDDNGRVTDRAELDANGQLRCVEIPDGTWHAVASLAPGTVLFEVKRGPFVPTPAQDFAAWAPAEGDTRCAAFESWFCRADVGESVPS